jgi:DnaJ-class molecular chaperone
MAKVFNWNTMLIESASLESCPRCKGFGKLSKDIDECNVCNGYGNAYISNEKSGWIRPKYVKLEKSVLY